MKPAPARTFDYRMPTAQVVIASDVPTLIRLNSDDGEIERRRGIWRRYRHPRRLIHAWQDCRGITREFLFVAPLGLPVPGTEMFRGLLLLLRTLAEQTQATEFAENGAPALGANHTRYLGCRFPLAPERGDGIDG
jgi:hypothetical protein